MQPQWVCDSINQKTLLAVGEYRVGKALPAHVSPFKEDLSSHTIFGKKGKDAEEMKFIHDESDLEREEEASEEAAEDVVEETFEVEKVQKKAKKAQLSEKQESSKLAKIMLSSKKKKILDKIIKNRKQAD